MKLAYAIHVDVDPTVLAGTRTDARDQVTEQVRAYLVEVLESSPVELRDAQVWARKTPERPKRMAVESIEPIDNGRFRVRVRVSDNRTTSRTFETRDAAEAWADQIDPVFLPDDSTPPRS